jgi:hypothetical protein
VESLLRRWAARSHARTPSGEACAISAGVSMGKQARWFGSGSAPVRRIVAAVLVTGGGAALAAALAAQVPEGWRAGMQHQRELVPSERAGFTFCRLRYQSVRFEPMGLGWSTDYPMADRNMTLRLGEFTTTDVNLYEDGEPAHAVVEATDPELFLCPFLFASDVGTAGFSHEEVESLREYFLKGGFLWVDDFWMDHAKENWLAELERILPGLQHVYLDSSHPLFNSFYAIEELPQIPNIGFWRRSGGETSEQGDRSRDATLSAVLDPEGRIVSIMTHNTDIADGMERESDDEDYFHRFSPYAYAVAINVAIFAMSR